MERGTSLAIAPAGRDARWRTDDRCGATYTRVLSGTVRVRDRMSGGTVVVTAGQTHRAPRSGGAPRPARAAGPGR
jgi:hypothetical protein